MKRSILFVVLLLAVALGAVACGGSASSGSEEVSKNEIKHISGDLKRLEKAEPTPILYDSADRAIQSNWYTAEADPNKIWYVEQLSYTGSVVASFTARGPVEPASDELTNPEQKECESWGEKNDGGGCATIGLAEPNGVYQHPGNEHIARLTDGALYRFEGSYAQSDQPFEVKTPESIAINGSAPISSTDLTKSAGGTLPPKG